ncbi:hypothetical protein GCM10027596_11660 [Nocardioides korecus]
MHPGDRHYRNQTLRIPDLAVVDDVIRDVIFENCILEGPAVLVMLGDGVMKDCTFDGIPDADTLIWEIPPERHMVSGAIVMINCQLLGCRIRRIGLGIRSADIEATRRGFGS